VELEFTEVGTGGNCTALQAVDGNGYEFLITDGDCCSPTNPDEGCVLGLFDPAGEYMYSIDFENLAAAEAKAEELSEEFHFAKNDFRR